MRKREGFSRKPSVSIESACICAYRKYIHIITCMCMGWRGGGGERPFARAGHVATAERTVPIRADGRSLLLRRR